MSGPFLGEFVTDPYRAFFKAAIAAARDRVKQDRKQCENAKRIKQDQQKDVHHVSTTVSVPMVRYANIDISAAPFP